MLVNGTINNLLGGVSQQTDSLRLPTQGEESINFYPSLVDGLMKRQPTEHFMRLSNSEIGNKAFMHVIERDERSVYLVVLYRGSLDVINIKRKTKCYVSIEGGADWYLQGNDFNMTSIADFTFIINKSTEVGSYTAGSKWFPIRGLLYTVKQAVYDTTYSLSIFPRNTTGTQLYGGAMTPKNVGTVENPPEFISTKRIVLEIDSKLYGTDGQNYIFKRVFGNTLYVTDVENGLVRFGKVDYEAEDSRGNSCIATIQNSVKTFAELPSTCVNDYFVEVTGNTGSNEGKYYLRFVCDPASRETGKLWTGHGTWAETILPEDMEVVNYRSMPYVLKRDGVNSFSFGMHEWKERTVGDEDSAPNPLFMNCKIQDMFLFRNRLGIIADDSVSLSCAGDLSRFYPKSVITTTDADPISIAVGGDSVVTLRHAVTLKESVLLFADNGIYTLTAPDNLSPETAAVKQLMSYDIDTSVRPVSSGETLFACETHHSGTSIKEFFVDAETGEKSSANITAHVPRYISKGPKAIACSKTENVLAVLTETEQDVLYIYKFHWSDKEKIQSSWCKFILEDATIQGMVFYGSLLFLTIDRENEGSNIEVIDFSDRGLMERGYEG